MCTGLSYAAEFIRFSPFRLKETLAFIRGCGSVSPNLKCWLRQTTGAIQLKEYWSKAATNHRRSVKKAQKRGYTAEVRLATYSDFAQASPFVQLYEHTMRRAKADSFYFFPTNYFATFLRSLPCECLYVLLVRAPNVEDLNEDHSEDANGPVVAAALYFHFGTIFHYHLGGSDTPHLVNGVNNLIHDSAARFACEQLCCELLHLGGGLKSGDSLFAFKHSIGDIELQWYIGASVLNQDVHDRLVSLRAAHLGILPAKLLESNFHPPYRDGVSGNELSPSNTHPNEGADNRETPTV
mmetsp:Transcript_25855/g.63624  ORF Transcript_25855/g.63624 Transcript_25855/m.63624 type:complete len:295 (-) Transcript_25855:208-1092(-)